MEHFKQGDCVLVSNDNKHWYHRHFYRIDDVWGGTGKALVYAEGKSPWTVSTRTNTNCTRYGDIARGRKSDR